MPTSLLEQWPRILELVKYAPREPGRVLDVGPGHGKAAVLLREYVPTVGAIDCLEAEPSYVAQFQLWRGYDDVRIGRFEFATVPELLPYGTLLMVDVIEHIDMELAKAQLRRFPGQVIICTPQLYEEAWRPGMPQSERHLCVWAAQDFAECGHEVEVIELRYAGWLVRLGARL